MEVSVTDADVKEAIENDPDFIALPRFKCSLRNFVDRYPDGAPDDAMIARALCMSEREINAIFHATLEDLRKNFR